jgi:hypothetical protein
MMKKKWKCASIGASQEHHQCRRNPVEVKNDAIRRRGTQAPITMHATSGINP